MRVMFLAVLAIVSLAAHAESLKFEVRSAETGEFAPCRIHVWDAAGTPVKHPTLPRWHDHVTCEGEATFDVVPGVYRYKVARGPEFESREGTIAIAASAERVEAVSLGRMVDMAARGWWSGETHIHRPVEAVPLLIRAEDLHVAPVITWWNKTNPWLSEPLPEKPLQTLLDNRFIYLLGGEDERGGGAFMYYNAPPMDVTQAGRETPSALEFAEQQLAAGAHIDMEKPFWWDMPAALALGRFHTIGIVNNHMQHGEMMDNEAWGKARPKEDFPSPLGNGFWTQHIYYQVLNAGYRIPPSAGSASGVLKNPVGYNRVYVYLGDKLDYKAWWEGLRAGRTMVTNGPLLDVTVEGERPGHVFQVDTGAVLNAEAALLGAEPVSIVQVVVNGEVVEEKTPKELAAAGRFSLTFEKSGWFLIRALGSNSTTFRIGATAPYYVEVKGAPFKPKAEALQFFIDWINERIVSLEASPEEGKASAIALQREARGVFVGKLGAVGKR
ncbi:MAG: CehA/McbA family metallohydrolase [Candidatus Hydrogenedentes bacterium]|nr:CehA/McbA family metallohydrolase [Candidatus Hydrogenedentota bacterium]